MGGRINPSLSNSVSNSLKRDIAVTIKRSENLSNKFDESYVTGFDCDQDTDPYPGWTNE